MNNKKKIILVSILSILIAGIGITYGYFTYLRNGTSNSQLVVGDIYMKYKETNQLTFENAMPSSSYTTGKYFEFQVTGKNTYTEKDIVYDIVLNYGDTHATRTTRIRDDLLKFRLVTVSNNVETEIFTDQSYSSINNKRIHATTIPKNTTSDITHTYRLYAWISNDTIIGTETGADYSISEWNDVYASVKVNVTGDFTEKEVARPINQVINTTTKDTGILFYNVNGTDNGNGLYLRSGTENDTYPIYYYRGNVDNNNVYFAENCWKIVRTTSTGGLKLVYNGNPEIVNGDKQCNNTTGESTQLSEKSAYYNSDNSPAYIGYSLPSKRYIMLYKSPSNGEYFGSNVDQSSHKLVDPVLELDSTHHYTYDSTDINATEISGYVRYYFYNLKSKNYYSSIKFPNTKNIETVLYEMLSDNTNTKNNPSTIQGKINEWWAPLDSTYGSYLEDTEWCNDRSLGSLGGWDPNGDSLDTFLSFTSWIRYDQSTHGSNESNIKNTNTPILTCSNPNDRLTVANGNLTYPIGLLTYDEVVMAGAVWSNTNTNFYLYTGQDYWLLSPVLFGNVNVHMGYMHSSGKITKTVTSYNSGVRPSLSLKAGTQILRGEGTKTKPYIITED